MQTFNVEQKEGARGKGGLENEAPLHFLFLICIIHCWREYHPDGDEYQAQNCQRHVGDGISDNGASTKFQTPWSSRGKEFAVGVEENVGLNDERENVNENAEKTPSFSFKDLEIYFLKEGTWSQNDLQTEHQKIRKLGFRENE